jgi:hypothetical protein
MPLIFAVRTMHGKPPFSAENGKTGRYRMGRSSVLMSGRGMTLPGGCMFGLA